MKTINILNSIIAFSTFSILTFSCSSENEEGVDESNVGLKSISVNLSLDENEENTRTSLLIKSDNIQSKWYSDDIVWAYSPAKKYYNKLVPIEDNSASFGQTEMHFISEGTVDYENGEMLILVYSGDKTGNTSKPGTGEGILTDSSLSFNRASDDNTMAIIYGNSDNHYSDTGNSFSVRGVAGTVTDGLFNASKLNMVSAMPKLRFSIPAIDTDDVESLSKLDYKIIVTLENNDGTENKGFPKTVKLNFLEGNDLKEQSVFGYPETDAITWGDDLKIKYTSNATERNAKSSSLWNYTETGKADDDIDLYKGYIFIPFPAINYTKLTVRVRVENNSGETLTEDLNNLCKTYTFTNDGISLSLKKDYANRIYDIGSIWTRTSSEPSAAPARIKAGNGWVVTENE